MENLKLTFEKHPGATLSDADVKSITDRLDTLSNKNGKVEIYFVYIDKFNGELTSHINKQRPVVYITNRTITAGVSGYISDHPLLPCNSININNFTASTDPKTSHEQLIACIVDVLTYIKLANNVQSVVQHAVDKQRSRNHHSITELLHAKYPGILLNNKPVQLTNDKEFQAAIKEINDIDPQIFQTLLQ